MTSMSNKLCNKKKKDYFVLIDHFCIRDDDNQMSLKRQSNHLISSNLAYFMATFSSLILFFNVNNSSNGFHKLQGYFRFYITRNH